MPKVSVIIPVYNTEAYLKRCLDSVCNQTLSDIEIICINDASTDKSLEILQEYATKDKRIKIIDFKENKGAGAARNAGINAAQGEYIGFVDSDDYVDLDFYEKLYKSALETCAEVIKSNLSYINNPEILSKDKYANLFALKESKYNLIHIPTTIIKKDFLSKNQILFPTDLSCAEDSVFEIKVAVLCNKIKIVDSVYYYYVFNNNSLNNTSFYNINKIKSHVESMSLIIDFLNKINISKSDYLSIIYPRFSSFNYICNTKISDKDKEIFSIEVEKLKNKIKYFEDFKNYNKFLIFKQIREKMESKK